MVFLSRFPVCYICVLFVLYFYISFSVDFYIFLHISISITQCLYLFGMRLFPSVSHDESTVLQPRATTTLLFLPSIDTRATVVT